MITREHIDTVRGSTAYSDDGSKLGKVGEVYLDNDSGEPAWVTVSTGMFGTRQSFVPLDGASLDGDDLRLPHSKATVKDAPNIGDDESLTPEAEDELYRHYGVDGSHGGRDASHGDRDRDRDGDGVRDRDGVQDRDHEGARDRDHDGDRDRDGDHGGTGRTAAAAGAAGVAGVAGGAAARGRGDHDDRDRDDRDRDGVRDRDDRDGGRGESVGERVGDRVHGDRDHDGVRDRDEDRDRGDDRDRDRDRDGGRRGSTGPRLRKHTVTEMQTITVPVEKEVYTLEDEDGRPVDDAQRDAQGRETGRHGHDDGSR
ncbi:hypothetical protein GCM10027047_23090 [Rhodococcus aerolatus]